MIRGLRSDNFSGTMESITPDSGSRIRSMEQVFGNQRMEMFTWDSGSREKSKDMART